MLKPRFIIWSIIVVFVLIGALWAFWPRPVLVDLVEIRSGALEVSISEEGEARVHDLYVVSAPAMGYLQRIDIEPGDCAYAGDTRLAVIHSSAAPALDARTVAQLRAAAASARAALRMAEADVRRQDAELSRATKDLSRITTLAASGTASEQALERSQAEVSALQAGFAAAKAAREFARHEVTRADAALIPTSQPEQDGAMGIVAPVSGIILRVRRDSEGPVAAGEPILEIGGSDDIEIMVDLLSEDAVAVATGDRVRVRGWGGPDLWGRVRVVEPYAFTKVSALGIEEQRANVAIELDGAPAGLGHGYRVRTDIIVWQADNVLRIPMTALFKSNGQWSAYKVQAGRARLTPVHLGHANGRAGEVLGGLEAGDRVVEHPSSQITDGVRVRERRSHQTTSVQDDAPPPIEIESSAYTGHGCLDGPAGTSDENSGETDIRAR